MEIDWGRALEIGGLGFLTVFIVLVALALIIWLIGYFINKSGSTTDEENGSKSQTNQSVS